MGQRDRCFAAICSCHRSARVDVTFPHVQFCPSSGTCCLGRTSHVQQQAAPQRLRPGASLGHLLPMPACTPRRPSGSSVLCPACDGQHARSPGRRCVTFLGGSGHRMRRHQSAALRNPPPAPLQPNLVSQHASPSPAATARDQLQAPSRPGRRAAASSAASRTHAPPRVPAASPAAGDGEQWLRGCSPGRPPGRAGRPPPLAVTGGGRALVPSCADALCPVLLIPVPRRLPLPASRPPASAHQQQVPHQPPCGARGRGGA